MATGDIGYLDSAGKLYVVGREEDVIITGGENVHPEEVERVLSEFPGIEAVAVYGVPDQDWGERVEAALVPSSREVSLAEIEAHAARRLGPHQRPKRWRFVDALPIGNTGKVERRRLSDETNKEA